MNIFASNFLILLAAVAIAGCGKRAPEPAPAEPAALVTVQPASTRDLRKTLSAYGTTEFNAANAATVAVQVESQVAELLVASGVEVKQGQALMRLLPSPATQLEFEKARRDAVLAASERERMQRLRADGLATESDLLTAVNAANAAVALRESLAARVGREGLKTLRAPRDGVVDTLTVQPGDVLAPGVVALRIAAPDALQVRLGVEPEDARLVAVGQAVQLSALDPGATSVMATIANIDRRVDPLTRLISALVPLPPHSALLPGAALRAEIILATHQKAVAVPRAALLYSREKAYLFLARDGKAQRREVTVGVLEGDAVEISSGLKPGEAVIIAGNSALEDGMAIRTEPEPDAAGARP